MMKRNLAKILVLVLIVALLVPATVNASGNYVVTLTLSDGTNTATSEQPYLAEEATIATLYTNLGDLRSKAAAKFPNTGLSSVMDELLAAYDPDGSSEWDDVVDGCTFDISGVADLLKSPSSATIADLLALGSNNEVEINATKTLGGTEYTVTLTIKSNAAPSGGSTGGGSSAPVTPATTETETETETEVVEVSGADITEDEPLVVEETVTVAESAEEATEIQITDIPETVEQLDVEVALEAAADAEVSENTTVMAIKDKDGNVTIIPMAIIEVDEDGNITAKGSLSEELTAALKDGGSLIAYDNEQPAFTDVTEALENETITQEEADAVAYWQARGVVEGEGNGTLGGIDEEVSRVRFATLLYRAFGAPTPETTAEYADLTGKFGYEDAKNAASWAAEAGLMNGVGNDEDGNALFGTGSIEAWQMALIMYRALGYTDSSEGYTDSWNWAVKNGLISGEKDATPAMPELLLMMQNLATFLDGTKLQGDTNLETPALDAAE